MFPLSEKLGFLRFSCTTVFSVTLFFSLENSKKSIYFPCFIIHVTLIQQQQQHGTPLKTRWRWWWVILSTLCHVCLYVFVFCEVLLSLVLLYGTTFLLLTGVYVYVVVTKKSGGELAKEHIITIFPYLASRLLHSIMNIICLHHGFKKVFFQYFHFLPSYEAFFFSLGCVNDEPALAQSYCYVCIFKEMPVCTQITKNFLNTWWRSSSQLPAAGRHNLLLSILPIISRRDVHLHKLGVHLRYGPAYKWHVEGLTTG